MRCSLLALVSACFAGIGSAQALPSIEPVAGGPPGSLVFADHGHVNPFTGGVAWETGQHPDALAMEWMFVGVSEVLPDCDGPFDWSDLDNRIADVAARGHQVILRPVFFGPGYGTGSYVPAGMPSTGFSYEGDLFDNPNWDEQSTQDCVVEFIDGFAAHFHDDLRVAYIQMGLAGLWGEHHLDGGPYTASNFPSYGFQKTMILSYLSGFGSTSSDLLTALSLDSAQGHGFFSSADASLDSERFSFFDDSLLIANHGAPDNWRQDPAPAQQLSLHRQHGWGGEAYWSGCNSDGSWAVPPHDCGNSEPLGAQALRLGLNYMLGDPAFTGSNGLTAEQLLTASQLMGYKFTATAASRLDVDLISVTVQNTGAAYSPYRIEVCTAQGCSGDLSTLAPGDSTVVAVPASSAAIQVLSLTSPRLDPNSAQKIRWSNAGANDAEATLTVEIAAGDDPVFSDRFQLSFGVRHQEP